MRQPPFRRILVANRGEIAVRVIRACRDMGISPVAVYSEVDRAARHVLEADEAHLIGAARAADSYLNQERILEAARLAGAQAIHPGYGFLSENAGFAEQCARAGIVFIGPPPEAIRAMGNKVAARRLMREAGVAVTPGSEGTVEKERDIRELAGRIGYPILLKAAAGGGGKGMRVVRSAQEIASALAAVRSEAQSSFGDGSVFVERFVDAPRHIEVQVLGLADGTVIHLGERECSIQRRHQKLVEEAPSPAVDATVRERLCGMAVKAAEAIDYRGAGTVEFIMDAARDVYFMEMNTRLQVEHPVTEMVTGVDLVQAQIRIAAGLDPGIAQKDVVQRGAAVECRIFAEDPDNGFLPAPGRIEVYAPPGGPGIREDSGVYEGWTIPMDYDPLIAKLVAWGRTRDEALDRMARALAEFRISGVPTTISFHRALMEEPDFRRGEFDTSYVERHPAACLPPAADDPAGLRRLAVAAALIAAREERLAERRAAAPMAARSPWREAGLREQHGMRLSGGWRR